MHQVTTEGRTTNVALRSHFQRKYSLHRDEGLDSQPFITLSSEYVITKLRDLDDDDDDDDDNNNKNNNNSNFI